MYDQLRVQVLSFPDFTDISNIWHAPRSDVRLDGKIQKELRTLNLHRTKRKELAEGIEHLPILLPMMLFDGRVTICEQTQKSQLIADIISVD